jgi:sulfur carrier protein ThiS
MLTALLMCVWSSTLLAQCTFVAEPIAVTSWYRSEGWLLPGVKDGKATAPFTVTINGKPPAWPEGVTVSEIVHDKGYHVSFPAAVFEENGKPKKMQARKVGLHRLLRWDINGQPYIYSYDLWPAGTLCTFSVDLVDEKGDGSFRLMVAPGHPQVGPQSPAPPQWAKKRAPRT